MTRYVCAPVELTPELPVGFGSSYDKVCATRTLNVHMFWFQFMTNIQYTQQIVYNWNLQYPQDLVLVMANIHTTQ